MHRRRVLILLPTAALAFVTYVLAQPPMLRPGTWSFTMTASLDALGDTSDLPPQLLEQLKQQFAQPNQYESCMTPEDVAAFDIGNPNEDEDDSCTETSRSIDGNVVTLTHACSTGTDSMRVEIQSPERFKVDIAFVSDDGSSNVSVTAHWLSSACSDD